MSEPPDFDPATIPLLLWFDKLSDELFPPSTERLLDVMLRLHESRPGTVWRFQKPGYLRGRLRGLRSPRELDRFLHEHATAKDLLSIYWYCLGVRRLLFQHRADTLGFQYMREMMGKRPNRLRFLRAVLKFAEG